IFRHQFGEFPPPTELMEPASHGFRRDREAVCGLKRRGEGRTTPPGAAPARDTRGFFEYGIQRAREPRHQDGRLYSDGELTIWIDAYAHAPGAIRSHNPVHAGA